MRTGFGRFAMELRASRRLTLSQFGERTGMSPQRICNVEFGRAPATDVVVGDYIRALNLNGAEAHELRTRASFANGLSKSQEEGHAHPPLRALFDTFSHQLSPKAVSEIQKILEREAGLTVSSLAFASNRMRKTSSAKRTSGTRPMPLPKRFVEICLLAKEKRDEVASEMEPVKIGMALEILCARDAKLDYQILDALPSFMDGAFACILGERLGHLICLEAKRFTSAEKGVYFARHAIAHELAHHYLHPDQLKSDGESYLPPQELSRNTPEMIGNERQIEQVVDNITESEAELFATMFLVPWTAYLKGTGLNYVADDYGEQLDEVKRYAPHFKNQAVINAFKEALWIKGVRRHPIFSLG